MSLLAAFAAVITLLYGVSALARIAPVKRRHDTWRQLWAGGLITAVTLGVAGSAYLALDRDAISFPADGTALTAQATSSELPLGVFTKDEGSSWTSVAAFGQQAGQPVRYVLDYLGPSQPFPARLGAEAAAHGAEPVLQLEPKMTMRQVAAGDDDGYLSRLAAQVREYRHRVVLSFAPEANGNWYQWGYTRTPAAQYRAAWAHVMHVFRADRDVTWMDTINRTYPGAGRTAAYIVPGVSMIGLDAYYEYPHANFDSVFGQTLRQIRAVTSKPVMISETGVGQVNSQASAIPNLVQGARANGMAGLIYFDEDQGTGNIHHQNWALTPAGAAALRISLASGPSSVPVLLYHGIYGRDDPESNSVSLAAFREQIAYLHARGYHTISPRQYQRWAAGQPVSLPARPVLITVDCNQSSFLRALPVLRQYRYRVVMYVVTGFADGAYGGPAGQRGYYLDWAQLKAMYRAGYIWPQFHAGHCGHAYVTASSPFGCGKGLTPTPDAIWGHRYYSDPMGQPVAGYHGRVERDVRQGLAAMESEFGLSWRQLTDTFAVPWSDYGQPQTTNQPWLASYFGQLFKVVFVQDNWVAKDNLRYRYEVDHGTTLARFTAALHSQLFTRTG